MAASDARHLLESSKDRSMSEACARPDNHWPANPSPANSAKPIHAARLRKHADYQRAYKSSRKQFSSSMTYFHALQQPDLVLDNNPRVGITAGRVLGKAVQRNRIKRRLREAIRANQLLLPAGVDVILHPRRTVADMNYVELLREISRIFSRIAGAGARTAESSLAHAGGKASSNRSASRSSKPQ